MPPASRQRRRIPSLELPEKANKVLNIILITLILIAIRLWHLAVVQHDNRLEEARKPQKRVILEPAKRATIRDRFNIPLAINKLQYQVNILYSPLKQIPNVRFDFDENGQKVKRYKRKEYITNLSQLLAKELGLDPGRIEDLIYSKAAFYNQVPFILKEGLTEKQYYRLKMLEKDWIGIQVQKKPVRFYPKGKVASDIIGYIGSINKREYDHILAEMQSLSVFLKSQEEGFNAEFPPGVVSLEQAIVRYKELQARAYKINDFVGKTGIELAFEEDLRGFQGRKSFYSDARGNFLKELPGTRPPLSGQRILLTISSELQEFAEKLLAQNEQIREGKVSKADPKNPSKKSRQPWIKGGAIVAIEPQSGDIIAMASHPRFDPNDFITNGNSDVLKAKYLHIAKWFESEEHLKNLWEQRVPLERELYDRKAETFYEEQVFLTWSKYLDFILPSTNPIRKKFQALNTIAHAIELQKTVDALLHLSDQTNLYALFNAIYREEDQQLYRPEQFKDQLPLIQAKLEEDPKKYRELKKRLDPYVKNIAYHFDKVLLVDLCKLAVDYKAFDLSLIKIVGKQPLDAFKEANANFCLVQEALKELLKDVFHEITFLPWRKENEKTFLKKVREEEVRRKEYAKPYIDHLDQYEQKLFNQFWDNYKWDLTVCFMTGQTCQEIEAPYQDYFDYLKIWHKEMHQGAHQALHWKDAYLNLSEILKELNSQEAISYLKTLRSYQQLNAPLYGYYRYQRKEGKEQTLKHLAAAFYPVYGFGYGRSYAYRQATPQGSLFKLVTAHEALKQKYMQLGEKNPHFVKLNPLTMVDQFFRRGKDVYVGYHSDGKPIPRLYKGGRLLKSSISSIGKIDLIKALETSSNPYFSLLAGDFFGHPSDLARAAEDFCFGNKTGITLGGEIAGKVPKDLETNRTGLYAMANGQHSLVVTPLQTAVMLASIANHGKILQPKLIKMLVGPKFKLTAQEEFQHLVEGLEKNDSSQFNELIIKRFPTLVSRQIFMPDAIRNILLEGMKKVVQRQLSEGLTSLSRIYKSHPEAISDYLELQHELIGKTSTAEKVESLDLDPYSGTNTYTHIWFGGIAFEQSREMRKETFVFKDIFGKPELVVVVYLRFGTWGKEAAPVAAQMVKKWREIKQHSADCYH